MSDEYVLLENVEIGDDSASGLAVNIKINEE